jgi:hypothetical protein
MVERRLAQDPLKMATLILATHSKLKYEYANAYAQSTQRKASQEGRRSLLLQFIIGI